MNLRRRCCFLVPKFTPRGTSDSILGRTSWPALIALGLLVPTLATAEFPFAGGSAVDDDETIQQLISEWDLGDFRRTQNARKKLAALGKKAVPALTALIENRHPHMGYAVQTLADMGSDARPALPVLLKVVQNKQTKSPDGWKWNVSPRGLLLSNVRKLSWAAKELVPVLTKIGLDETEPERLRTSAVYALGGMGKTALPSLREFLKSDRAPFRSGAANAVAAIEIASGKSKVDAWQEIIDANPFDSNVPSYLASMKGIYNSSKLHPPTQVIKKLYREKLAEEPDAELAWTLASIIRNQLSGTDLMWASPSDSYRRRSFREDPAENYDTLASVLDMVVNNSKPDSERFTEAVFSLARLRLLQGDWEGMNAWLEKVGEGPIPAEIRPVLTAPPQEWKGLKASWQPADKKMRSGDCGIEFRFLRRGQRLKGVQGVHVLVKQRPEPVAGGAFMTGIKADTLFLATQPMKSGPFGAFGYVAKDRNVTRYAVSNKNGVVRIEGLPNKPMVVEILVPTANFAEQGQKWDLLMATADGLKLADRSNPKSVDANKPPSVVELVEGEVVRYPQIFVRSPLMTSSSDWDKADADDFVLTWTGPSELQVDHYNVRLTLSAPTEEPDNANRNPAVATQTVETKGTSWPIGERGVGSLKLVPGNIYLVEVEAVRKGKVLSNTPKYRIWVPWKHRQCDPPKRSFSNRPAFYDNIWLRTNVEGKSLEERLPALIKNSPEMFETEYHRLGMAWLDLHKNKANAADQLRALVSELPAGNVVRMMAKSLLDLSAKGKAIPKRFRFVAP